MTFASQYLRMKAISTSWVPGLRKWFAYPRKRLSAEIFFLASCSALAYYFVFSPHFAIQDQLPIPRKVVTDLHDNETTLPKDSKYILLWSWTSGTLAPFYSRGEGEEAFFAIDCSVPTCYVTSNRNLFGGDLTKFHALLFHGHLMHSSDLPKARSHHQHYIFYAMESADNYLMCEKVYDGFFNWTSTYRLDSDLPYPYILIRDRNGAIVGPKLKMRWNKIVAVDNDTALKIIQKKNRAAAWFSSNCKPKSRRRSLVTQLRNALTPYGLTIDVFGKCGTFRCLESNLLLCNDFVKEDYYFYLSFENSFDVDYVTDKLLLALQNEIVPIVYGGADYTRFLPPGSYIDARKYSIDKLAEKMVNLMLSPAEYGQYFWWKDYYVYHDPRNVENVCALCEALHNQTMLNITKIHKKFRKWWNPIMKRCLETRHSSGSSEIQMNYYEDLP